MNHDTKVKVTAAVTIYDVARKVGEEFTVDRITAANLQRKGKLEILADAPAKPPVVETVTSTKKEKLK